MSDTAQNLGGEYHNCLILLEERTRDGMNARWWDGSLSALAPEVAQQAYVVGRNWNLSIVAGDGILDGDFGNHASQCPSTT